MEKDLFTALASIATAVVGVAIIATLVSKNAQTSSVISSAGNAYAGVLSAALSPVTGSALGAFNNNNIAVNSNLGL